MKYYKTVLTVSVLKIYVKDKTPCNKSQIGGLGLIVWITQKLLKSITNGINRKLSH